MKNDSYVATSNSNKFFIKFSKKENIKSELFGINYFDSILNVETPKIINFGIDYIITKYDDKLYNISHHDISKIVAIYQNNFQNKNMHDKLLEKNQFSRNGANKLFSKNIEKFLKFNTNRIEDVLYSMTDNMYEQMPKIISHGDIHRRNVFLKNKKIPFILDFEKIQINYPTFDISTHIFYNPNEAENIIYTYLKNQKNQKIKKISNKEIINFILSDTLRISIYDTINSYKKLKNQNQLMKRIEHNDFIIKKIFNLS